MTRNDSVMSKIFQSLQSYTRKETFVDLFNRRVFGTFCIYTACHEPWWISLLPLMIFVFCLDSAITRRWQSPMIGAVGWSRAAESSRWRCMPVATIYANTKQLRVVLMSHLESLVGNSTFPHTCSHQHQGKDTICLKTSVFGPPPTSMNKLQILKGFTQGSTSSTEVVLSTEVAQHVYQMSKQPKEFLKYQHHVKHAQMRR